MPVFQDLGFKNHPFTKTNADEEQNLGDYFVPPPFFDGVIGDSSSPSPCIVLAPRGAGKTAQRRMVEAWAVKNKVLAVTYDRFEFGKEQDINSIGLPYHIRNIIIRILIAYLSYLNDYPDLLKNLDGKLKKTLSIFIHTYIGQMTGSNIQEVVNELKSLPQRFKEFWANNVGVLESAVNVLLKSYGLEAIDLPDLKLEEKKLSAAYKHQLEILSELVKPLGFISIYILMDKLDETEKTGGSPEKTYRLLQPIARDLELLGLNGYGFKIFTWDKVEPFFRKDARPDRVTQFNLSWARQSLEKVLSHRLIAFSDGNIRSFGSLLESDPGFNIDSILCILANGSPRNLIRLCEKIFSVQGEINPGSSKISLQALDRGILSYCEQISIETYGDEVVRDVQKVGVELFTINYLSSSIFKMSHENTSRNKVTHWSDLGMLVQIGSVNIEGIRRPLNFYYIVDPALTRLITRSIDLKTFIKDRLVPCSSCNADNIMNVELFPKGNDPVCYKCNRNLF